MAEDIHADLDHVAIGLWDVEEGARVAVEGAGGQVVARFGEKNWKGLQVAFVEGIRLELLEPVKDPLDDFLRRFLQRQGPAPHHLTFKVSDLRRAVGLLGRWGIEAVKVDLDSETWKEAFLHPKLGLGTVVQLAQPMVAWSAERELPPYPDGLLKSALIGIEVRANPAVSDRVYGELLQGRVQAVAGGVAYSWPGGGTVVVRPPGGHPFGVEKIVFRILRVPSGQQEPPRDAPLYAGPTTLVRLWKEEEWP